MTPWFSASAPESSYPDLDCEYEKIDRDIVAPNRHRPLKGSLYMTRGGVHVKSIDASGCTDIKSIVLMLHLWHLGQTHNIPKYKRLCFSLTPSPCHYVPAGI